MLRNLDALVYDLQDTGCRSYTYIATMGLAMEACGQAGIPFCVLDRPNPLGGQRVEGPVLEQRFRSFVGFWPIPYVYGLTCGELARMINGERWITNTCKLSVVPMQHWRRSMTWSDTRLRWVPTSPNVPQGESVLYLVATGLVGELGGLSIGMGTRTPFQCLGAPYLDGARAGRWLNGQGLRGVRFTPTSFTPTRGLYRGCTVKGVRLQFSEPATAPLFAVNWYALEMVRRVAKRDLFAEAVKRGQSFSMFDRVNGTDATRQALQAGRPARELVAGWHGGEEAFRRQRAKYLLYR
jgi:uncharacterized protein YbbC (DUF1343 family)